MASWSGNVTIFKEEYDGHEWHAYRRGKNGPLAVSVRNKAMNTFVDLPVTPRSLEMLARALFGVSQDYKSAPKHQEEP